LAVVVQEDLRGKHLFLMPRHLAHLQDELLLLVVVSVELVAVRLVPMAVDLVDLVVEVVKQPLVPPVHRDQEYLDKVMPVVQQIIPTNLTVAVEVAQELLD